MIPARLHLVIANKRNLILEMFVSEVRVFRLAPAHLTNAEIAQDIDDYLTAIIDALAHGMHRNGGDGPRSPEAVRIAVLHAQHRARLGWNVRALLTEMGILRSTIVEVASQAGSIPVEEWERLADVMHEGMTEAAAHLAEAPRTMGATKSGTVASPTLGAQARGSR